MKADSGQKVFEFSGGGRELGYPVAFTLDARVLAAQPIFKASMLVLYDASTGKALGALVGPAAITATAFAPNGKNIATGTIDGMIRLWDVDSRREIGHARLTEGLTTELRFSPDGKTILVARGDRVHLLPVTELLAKGAAPQRKDVTPAARVPVHSKATSLTAPR